MEEVDELYDTFTDTVNNSPQTRTVGSELAVNARFFTISCRHNDEHR